MVVGCACVSPLDAVRDALVFGEDRTLHL